MTCDKPIHDLAVLPSFIQVCTAMGNSSNYHLLPMSEFVDGSDFHEDEPPRKKAYIQRPPTQRFLLLVILLQIVAFVAIAISYSLKSRGLCSTGNRFLVYCKHVMPSRECDLHSWTLKSAGTASGRVWGQVVHWQCGNPRKVAHYHLSRSFEGGRWCLDGII